MISEKITCDVCGTERKQTNHWWIISIGKGGLILTAWDDDTAKASEVKHLCGQQCVHKAVDEFVGKAVAA